ncbi:choice-of-anchor H family protein [Shewanella sedimentimangrovi]|uniref:Choice-of-anchor H family protein n=2 Tax=Shewanella sedimentimangrovi TaxID=2814293 RepID=A0ABX7R1C6_9GAMM|nr:choice-of-anchor H family protein [Shewanella sedimentimangrovi]
MMNTFTRSQTWRQLLLLPSLLLPLVGQAAEPSQASLGRGADHSLPAERLVDDATLDKLSPVLKQLNQVQALPATPMTREQVQSEKHKGAKLQRSAQLNSGVYHEFSFYDAFARLLEDRDYDGFYSSFSVTFDADVYSSYAGESVPVYAELYLSYEGGDWIRYFTTENFIIQGQTDLDDYEVVTTLAQGYRLGHYDVLIDLYEVGYGDVVATISSDDTDGLYALPLEAAATDLEYVAVSDGHGGGALGWLALTPLAWLAWRRRRA